METIQKSDIREIMKKLAKLEEDVEFIKENIVDVDSIITEEDRKDFEEYEKEKREGRLINEYQLKKELRL